MKKITSEHFSEDDNLVKFLQTHEPIPPSEVKPCEELIMRRISLGCTQENITTQKKCHQRSRTFAGRQKLLWFIPITIITSVVTVSSQLLRNNQPSPQTVSSYEEMESFMINTWQGSMSHEPEEEYLYLNSSY